MPTDPTWVFGYGSLASPVSMAETIGRAVTAHEGFLTAHLDGYGRRWNYGSLRQRRDWHGPHGYVEAGVVVCLGIEPSASERCNGVVIRVTESELVALDRRESDYDRTDVTGRIITEVGGVPGRVVTYVPRRSAIDRYSQARDQQRAAVLRAYHELVHDAFRTLGHEHLHEFAGTRAPDVPIVDPL